MSTLIDLSHTIFDGLVTYKGLPAPIICDYLSRENSKAFYEAGTEFQIGKIEMVTNTGTYLDCPFHRFEHGKDLSQIALEQCAELDAIVINAKDATAVGTLKFHTEKIKLLGKSSGSGTERQDSKSTEKKVLTGDGKNDDDLPF